MTKRTKSMIIQVPVETAYKMARNLEGTSLPLLSDVMGGASPSGLMEDIPNQKVVLKCKGGGSVIDQSFTFRAIDHKNTEVIIGMEAGILGGKMFTDTNLWIYVFSFKALEMGYLAAPKGANDPYSCKKCGKELKAEFSACPYCGTPR